MRKVTAILVIMFVSLTALAGYPSKVIYSCEMWGLDLISLRAKVMVTVSETYYPNSIEQFLAFEYTILNDDIYNSVKSLPVVDVSTPQELRLSHVHTREDHRFTTQDSGYVKLDLSRQLLNSVAGKTGIGYAGFAGLRAGTRTITGKVFCFKKNIGKRTH